MVRQPRGIGAKRGGAKVADANQQRGGKRPSQKTVHPSILRISGQNVVSIFHRRCAAQPGIVAIVAMAAGLGDYDDDRPDLIQSNTKEASLPYSVIPSEAEGPRFLQARRRAAKVTRCATNS
jgi:hypothetical protein